MPITPALWETSPSPQTGSVEGGPAHSWELTSRHDIIGRVRQFGIADKVGGVDWRIPTRLDLAAKQTLEHGIDGERGGLYLDLAAAQYEALSP